MGARRLDGMNRGYGLDSVGAKRPEGPLAEQSAGCDEEGGGADFHCTRRTPRTATTRPITCSAASCSPMKRLASSAVPSGERLSSTFDSRAVRIRMQWL